MDPPRPLAAHDVKFPPYELQTLPNGLQVVAVLHHEQPAVSMRLLVRAGAASDPKEKLGLAKMAAILLDQGTTTKSAEEMNDAIDFIGGAMGAGAAPDLSQMSVVVMKDSFETGMRDAVRHGAAIRPSRRAEIDRQKQQALSGLQVSFAGSRVHRQRRLRSAGLRLPSVRPAAERHAGDARRDHARRSGRVPPEVFRRRTTRSSRSSAT